MAGGALLFGLLLLGTSAAVEGSKGRIGVLQRQAERDKRFKNMQKFYNDLNDHLAYNMEIENEVFKKFFANTKYSSFHIYAWKGFSAEERCGSPLGVGHRFRKQDEPAPLRNRELAYIYTNNYMNHLGYDSYHYHNRPGFYEDVKQLAEWERHKPGIPDKNLEEYTWEELERLLLRVWDNEYFHILYRGLEPRPSTQHLLQEQIAIYDKVKKNRIRKQENLLKEREEAAAKAKAEKRAKFESIFLYKIYRIIFRRR